MGEVSGKEQGGQGIKAGEWAGEYDTVAIYRSETSGLE